MYEILLTLSQRYIKQPNIRNTTITKLKLLVCVALLIFQLGISKDIIIPNSLQSSKKLTVKGKVNLPKHNFNYSPIITKLPQ